MTTDTGLQPWILAINATCPSLAVIFVALRLYSRYFITRNLGWDDSLIVISMVLSITLAVTTQLTIKTAYGGYHSKDIVGLELKPVLVKEYSYASQILYNPILALVKNAVLVFFLNLGRTFENLRVFIICLLVLNNLMMVAIFFTAVFQCTPIMKTFHPEIAGTCISTPHFFIATAALTILTDLLVLVIPTWLLWDIRLKPKKKIATIFLLSLGCLVTSISVYRMWYLITVYFGGPNPDPMYTLAGTSSGIEVNLAIITACGPSMKPLITRFLPNFLERDTTDDHASAFPDALTFSHGHRLRAYSANASASKSAAKLASLGSGFGSDVELQQSSSRSLRSAKYGRSLEALDEEDDDNNTHVDVPSRRREISTVPSILIMGQNPVVTREETQNKMSSAEAESNQRPACGITRQVTVHITYSPSKTRHET